MGGNRGKSSSSAEVANATKCNSQIAPASGLSYGARGRAVDGCRPREPLGAPRRYGDPAGLPTWAARQRAGGAALGRHQPAGRKAARAPLQGRGNKRPPARRSELRALRRLQRDTPEGQRSVHVFVSERLAPLSVSGYQRMVARAAEAAKFPFLISSHVLRHSCGYKLANDGQDTRAIQHYLGHRSIASTVRYTKLAPDRFKGFWRD